MAAVAPTIISKGPKANEGILVGVRGPLSGREYALVGEAILIGRGNDCDIVLNDLNASRHHLIIRNQHGRYQLDDQQSRNGTYLNGKKIDTAMLKNGDVVSIGESALRFRTAVSQQEVKSISQKTLTPQKSSSKKYSSQKTGDFHANLESKGGLKLPLFGKKLHLENILNNLFSGKKVPRLPKWLLMVLVAIMGILTAMLFSPSHSHKRDHKDSESLSRASETTAPANSSPINTSLIGSTRLASAAITITANPSLARELYSQGMQALDSGDYKRAISRFQEVLKSDPTHPIAKQKIEQSKQRLNDQIQEYYNNGLREYSKLYYDRAQREWEKVAALSSDFSSEYFDKANRKINEAKAKLMETR